MARARNIKPAFFKNEELAGLPFWTRLLFIGLWCLADREGRLEDRPKRIKMEIFPGDDVNIEEALNELDAAKFISRYEADGKLYIQIIHFLKHQNPHHREPPSTIPKPEAGPGHGARPNVGKPEAGTGSDRRDTSGDKSDQPAKASGQPRSSPADSGFLIPDSPSRIPDSGLPPPGEKPAAAARRRPAEDGDDPAARARPTWKAYIAAIQVRYPGRTVLRDETANVQMAKFVKRVGVEAGPEIAALYVSLNKRRYLDCHHSVATMLVCVEELYSQWTSGRRISEAESRQADQTSARVEQVHRLTREKAA